MKKFLFLLLFSAVNMVNLKAQNCWQEVSTVDDSYLRIVKTNDGNYLCAAADPATGLYTNALYQSPDLENWTPLSYQFPSQPHLAFNKDNFGNIFLSTGHNGLFKSNDNGISWSYANVGGGYGCGSLDIVPDSYNNLFVGVGGYCRGLHVSGDGGSSWENKIPGRDFSDIEYVAAYNQIYACNTNFEIFSSIDNGVNWNQLVNHPFSNSAIMIKSIESNIFIFCNNGDIYQSQNGGESWDIYTQIPVTTLSSPYANDVVILSPSDWIVGFNQNGVWHSDNGGASWSAIDSCLVGDFHYFFQENSIILATTSTGIYKYTGFTPPPVSCLPNYVPTDGLVGYWPFCGNANDESGNGNDGTVNGAILTTDRNGNENSAYSFDGVDDYIQTIYAGPSGNGISASYWFSSGNDNLGTIISYGGNYWGELFEIRNNYWAAETVGPCYGPSFHNHGSLISSENSIQVGSSNWHNVIVILPQNGPIDSVKFYIDGQALSGFCSFANYGAPNPFIMDNNTIRFGRNWDIGDGDYHFIGSLDDIGIWNRALTPEEITALYNGTSCAQNTMITPGVNEISIGVAATFTASSDDANPTYVWQSDLGQGYQSLNDIGNYSGTETDSLTISNVQLANHNQPVRVVSISGNCSDTSNVAYIQILDTCINVVQDTIFTELVDTSYVTQNIYDTLTTQVYDTSYVTQNIYDTLTTQVFDTTYVTLNIYDTLLTTVTDTLVIQTQISGITPETYNTLRVFPNPASTHITIDYGNFAAMNGYTLTIINSLGQTVFTTLINQQTSYIDLATWTGAGMYYVQLIDPMNNTVENRKIVLE